VARRHVRHIRRLVAQRRIPYLKWSRHLRFDPDDITAWLALARVPADNHQDHNAVKLAGATRVAS
jgi:hypothetical protein